MKLQESDAIPPQTSRVLGARTAVMLVVASMVGSGVFTTTGFLLRDLASAPAVLAVWALGGILATCGALAYAELVAALPENGGEYALLSRIYHPGAGFVAGWVSLIVGFSAPTAAAAMAFGAYMQRILPQLDARAWALGLIAITSVVHATGARLGGRVHDAITALDVLLIGLFLVGGLVHAAPTHLTAATEATGRSLTVSGSAAVGLVYVSYSYSGWNGAAYVAGEVRDPGRALPRALLLGTTLVTLLYVALNFVFLTSAPASQLTGVLEVGHVAAAHLFGAKIAPWISALVAVGLATSVSAAIMTGPRTYERMGRDYALLRALAPARDARGPIRAIALQAGLATALVMTATFEALLTYVGFTLTLVSGLTVAGVFVLRWREPRLPRPYRAWGHPFTTGLALALVLWMAVFTLIERPAAALAGLTTIASGLALYALTRRGSQIFSAR